MSVADEQFSQYSKLEGVWLPPPEGPAWDHWMALGVKSALKGRALPKGCKLFLRHFGVKDSIAKLESIAVSN
jgi:hypothetical protein